MPTPMRYVEVHCKTCGADFQMDIGDLEPAKAEELFLESYKTGGFHCPGKHVELNHPKHHWQINWTVKSGEKDTDEDFVAKLKEKYNHVVSNSQLNDYLKEHGLEITSFMMGVCIMTDRDGKKVYSDFANAPSGERYYFWDRKE